MRALSAEDAAALRVTAGTCCSNADSESGAALRAALARLAMRGCVVSVPPPSHAPPIGHWVECYNITTLGSLALRVAVAIPAVSL